MLDRLGNEVDFSELFMEETLSAKDRKELDDSMYGIVYTDVDGNKVRKYPLNDEKHVLQAVRFFNKAEEKYKPELARNIVKRAKELDMEWENWDVLKPYLDKPVKESYDPDPYSISGTSGFDECINDDEYYGEADQALMNQIQKNEDNIPLFQLRTYAKNHLSKRSVMGNTELIFKIGREYTGNNSFEKRCHEYFLNLICEIDKCIKKSGDKISAVKKPKWFFYERKIKQLFNLIGVGYAKDRVLSYISGNRGIISFEEKESIKYTYDPNTDILIHRSRHPNINMLIPSHESRDGIVYPRPRIYCYLEQRADFRLAAQDNGQYGDNVYEIVIPKSITVFRDMEYGKPHDNNKYAKEVFINTNVPLKAKPITYDNTGDQINQQQTTNNTSPPSIQESFNEMFGEKVSLENMYQESSTDMMKVNDLECDELYFGSDTKYPVEIDLNRPLFVTPLKGIASIFVGRADLNGIIPKGSYNLDYKEWGLPDKELMKPLKTVHVYVEGYPDLKEQEITLKGYIHCIPFKYYKDNIYRYPWMSEGVEYLIANTENMKVEFTRIIECEVKYIVKGVPSDNPKYGPYKNMNETIEGWRVTHKGEGIYEALKNAMWNITRTPKAWTEFKNSEACSWLPEPPSYGSNDRSYFTRLGYDTFMERTFPIMKKYLNEEDIEVSQTVVSSSDIVYRDQYQFVTDKSKTVQEGAWNDVRNGVNPWSDKLIFHISPEGHLDGQVFKPRVPEYLDKYDPSQTNFEDVDNPRICFSTSIEGALNAILVNIGRWKTAEKLNNWYVYIPEKPLKDYKHSTNKNIIEDKKVFDANLTKEIWIEEPVRLKQYGIIRIDQVKSVARRKTVPTINGEKGDRNYYSFKWHWLVRPSVLKNIPYDYSPIAVCNNMLDDISKYKYGLGMNGSTHSVSSKEYNEKYRLESPEEFEKNGGGICYDFVEWQAGYLDAYGYTCRKFYIYTDTKEGDTHTFILVDDGKGGFIYPEAAFKPMEGVYAVKSPEEAALKVMGHIFDINDNDEKYDEIKYYVWEYKDHPAYGSTIKECMEYFSKGEPFYEGMAKNKKE